MARKKREAGVADDLEGTVEGLAVENFQREKAGYEERTGEKVLYEMPVPVTRTPIPVQEVGEVEEAEEVPAIAEGDGED